MAEVRFEAGRPPSWFKGDADTWADYLQWYLAGSGGPLCVLNETVLSDLVPDWLDAEGCPYADDGHDYDETCALCGWDGPQARAEARAAQAESLADCRRDGGE